MPDPYSATWVSHSSIADFLACPRAYFLKNMYKEPSSRKKIQVVTPALTLGAAVHEVLEALSILPVEKRMHVSLLERLANNWSKYAGMRGGFETAEQEERTRLEAEEQLRHVMQHPGPLLNKAVKIQEDLPHYWLSEEDEIILCGKIDWLEYLPESDAVHIIDFKTGRNRVESGSLQLPIYHLLVHNTQQRTVAGVSYWYLRMSDAPEEESLPALATARPQVLEIAKRIKLARKLNRFKCPSGELGCRQCRPLELVVSGEAVEVGEGEYGRLLYVVPSGATQSKESSIL